MKRQPVALAIAFLAGWLGACGTPEGGAGERDLLGVLADGAFLPTSDLAILKPRGPSAAWVGDAWWRPCPALPLTGWGRANAAGWRPMGARATARLWHREPRSSELVLEIHRRPASEEGAPEGDLTVDLRLGGEPLGRLEVPEGRSRGRFKVPAAVLEPWSEIEMRFEPPLEQSSRGRQPIAVERLGLVAPGEDLAQLEARPTHKLDPGRRTLFLLTSGQFVAPLTMPAGAGELRFELRVSGPGAVPWSLDLFTLDGDGERHPLASLAGDAGHDAPRPYRLPIAGLEGQDLCLIFDATLEGDGRRLEIRAPRLAVVGERKTVPSSPAADELTQGEPVRPDIILILLDAARGDRFLPEHPRRATPNIDRLASRALRFRRAYSECSSTSCAIPALITSLPFLDAGIGSQRRLDDQVQTLAESLRERGYRTVGFSANPNNTKSRNLHQGFDEFHALWGRNKDHGPYGMSRRAAEVIAEQAPGTPLFLQLHYLPPHEPYDPKPEFDVYRDRDYRGPFKPRTNLRPYRASRGQLTQADVTQLVDLYDGNLLMADDAVQRVFDALKTAGRWRHSVVLFTSDHGEAFWEHDRQGHNSTVFDEMLHIPFILRLPGDHRPAGVDASRVVTLADVVPTLLALAGTRPPAGAIGIDLLSAPQPDPRRPRTVFHRTGARNTPTYAARTPRWKAIVRPRLQQQALYDLRADPGEHHNLIQQHPLIYAGLALRLRRHIALAARLDTVPEEVELPADDREVLRSLGYIQ